jgi:two-component system sensor histidine kinase KdpD
MNVYTTLNVQHIETLNDVIAQLTGVQVRETVPDTIFDHADDVELVDLPPDELLQRMAEGKVYIPEQAAAAMRNFFQKGNLVALRELALRRTAERVNIEAEAYRPKGAIRPTAERLMVCVGPSPLSARLVRATARMAASLRAPWLAVSVLVPGMWRMSEEVLDRMWANLELASRLGAEIRTVNGTSIVHDLLAYARAANVTKIIVGKPVHSRWREWFGASPVYELVRQSGPIDVYAISGEEGPAPQRMHARSRPTVPWRHYLLAVLVVGLSTAVGHLSTGPDLSILVMIYLVGVIAVALQGRRGPALLASVLSASALNFFFIPPLYTFTLANPLYWVTVAVLALTGMLISTLIVRMRQRADAARQGEIREATLFSVSRELSEAATADQVVEVAQRHLGRLFECDVLILLPDGAGRLTIGQEPAGKPPVAGPGPQDLAVAQWALEHDQSAGRGTDTLPACAWLFAPLPVSGKVLGVAGLRPFNQRPLTPDEQPLLMTLTSLIAAALERIRLADHVGHAEA